MALFPPLHVGRPLGFATEAALEALGLPCEARCGGGAAAWVAGVLAAPGSQGCWRLGQQEIQCSRRAWQPVLASTLQCSCLENLPPRQRSLEGHSPQSCKVLDTTKAALHAKVQDHFFASVSFAPVRAEHEGGTAAWLAGTLASPSVQGHGLPLPQETRPHQSRFSSLL